MSARPNPMPLRTPICPICEQVGSVGKVSSIYVLALEAQHSKAAPTGERAATQLAWLDSLSRAERIALGQRLAPPSAPKKLPMRPLHPDMIVVVFSAVLPVFVIGIRSSQPAMFFPIVAVLLAGYALYFWKRHPAIDKYERQVAARQASTENVKRALERWMRLYYCLDDDIVFEAGGRQSVPADQIAGYLLSE